MQKSGIDAAKERYRTLKIRHSWRLCQARHWRRQQVLALIALGILSSCADPPTNISVQHKTGGNLVIHHRSIANQILTDRIEVITPGGNVTETILRVSGVSNPSTKTKITVTEAEKEAAIEAHEMGAPPQ